MNPEPMSCPKCLDNTLRHFNTETDSSQGTFEEWSCECGHYETHRMSTEESAFDKWALELGYDKINLFGKFEAMRLAFDAGRGFEAEVTTAQLKLINESLQDSPMAKKQA